MRLTTSAILAVLSAPALAAPMLAPGPDDLVATRVVALPAPAGALERKPVSFGWALDPAATVAAQPAFVGESREWYQHVEAAQLRAGVAFDATAPGAVVRLSPLGTARPVATSSLQLRRDGRDVAPAQAFAKRADADTLKAAGFDPGAGSVVAQIDPALGAGRFEIRQGDAQGRYLLHVFEPDSAKVLHAGATRASVHAGGSIEVRARLEGTAGTQFGGQLVSPSGRTVDLAFVAGADGLARASARLPGDAAVEAGLWEAQVFAEGRDGTVRVQRDGRAPIAVVQPTARLLGDVRVGRAGLGYALPVQVGAPGRYEVAATLFATGRDGLAHPVAQSASAAWLEPGTHTLRLAYDRAHVPAGFGAPYELRGLTLKDQGRMGLLESRAVALKVSTTVEVARAGRR